MVFFTSGTYISPTETGFYYLTSRYYDPEIGRFINADTVDILKVQDDLYDKNLFAYCDNDPVNRDDTDGEMWNLAITGGGSLVGAWAAGSSNIWNPVGWAILGVATVATVTYTGYKVYEFAKNSKGATGRPGLKKQGRERLEKKKSKNWKKRSEKKERSQPRPHHPSKKGHRKY